jgi:hypothetical protein
MNRHRSVRSKACLPPVTFIVVLLCLIGPGTRPAEAAGVPYKVGDVFAGVGEGKIKHFSPDGDCSRLPVVVSSVSSKTRNGLRSGRQPLHHELG